VTRPPVSVVVPFKGSDAEADELLATLEALERRPGDELVAVDNSADGVLARRAAETVVAVVAASIEASSYYARNAGVVATSNEWLLFLDAGCTPLRADLIDAYFEQPIAERTGILAGAIHPAPGQPGIVPAFAASRRHLDQAAGMAHPHRPFGVTANLLVRRSTWDAIGGFCDRARSGGDQDFCWRAQSAGWQVELRAAPAVEHEHRASIRALARQFVRYGAGSAWLLRRHPAQSRRVSMLRAVPKLVVHGTRAAAGGHGDELRYRGLDFVVTMANNLGYLLGNRPPRSAPAVATAGAPPITCLHDRFPPAGVTEPIPPTITVDSEDVPLHIEAARRPELDSGAALTLHVSVAYGEDDGLLDHLTAMVWLFARRPHVVLGRVLRSRADAVAVVAGAPALRRIAGRGGSVRCVDGDCRSRMIAELARPSAGGR
jgi:GT2 family glycosyltransferase